MKLVLFICLVAAVFAAPKFTDYQLTEGHSCKRVDKREVAIYGQESAAACMALCQRNDGCVAFTYYALVVPSEANRRCMLCARDESHESGNDSALFYKKVPQKTWWLQDKINNFACGPPLYEKPEVIGMLSALDTCIVRHRTLTREHGRLTEVYGTAKNLLKRAENQATQAQNAAAEHKAKATAAKAKAAEAEKAVKAHSDKLEELTEQLNEARAEYQVLASSHADNVVEKEKLKAEIEANTEVLQAQMEAQRKRHAEEKEYIAADYRRVAKAKTASDEEIKKLQAKLNAMEEASTASAEEKAALEKKLNKEGEDRISFIAQLKADHAAEIEKIKREHDTTKIALADCVAPPPAVKKEAEADVAAVEQSEARVEEDMTTLTTDKELGPSACEIQVCKDTTGKSAVASGKGQRKKCLSRASDCEPMKLEDVNGKWKEVARKEKGGSWHCVKKCKKVQADKQKLAEDLPGLDTSTDSLAAKAKELANLALEKEKEEARRIADEARAKLDALRRAAEEKAAQALAKAKALQERKKAKAAENREKGLARQKEVNKAKYDAAVAADMERARNERRKEERRNQKKENSQKKASAENTAQGQAYCKARSKASIAKGHGAYGWQVGLSTWRELKEEEKGMGVSPSLTAEKDGCVKCAGAKSSIQLCPIGCNRKGARAGQLEYIAEGVGPANQPTYYICKKNGPAFSG